MLEANPKLSAVQAKEILKNTARLDDYTGNIGPQGDLKWGWGKANALAAVLASEVYANINNAQIVEDVFTIYPNPATEEVTVELKSSYGQENIDKIELIQLDGKVSKTIENTQVTSTINVSSLTKGTYIVRVYAGNHFGIKKLIIQ
jgi:hypothetical protein